MDVRQKLVGLLVCYNDKEVTLKLIRIPMVGEGKLNLVSIDQIMDE